jgi:hypothetical protein
LLLGISFRVLVCGGIVASPAISWAAGASPLSASADQKKEATAHFTAGKQALAAKDFDKAISEFSASIEVVDSPNAHLELARTLRDAGKLGEAWGEYWHAAESATRLAPQEERYAKTAEAATNEREEVARKLAFLQISVSHAPADATLKVGGRVVPVDDWGSPVVVTPGAVDVTVTGSAGAELARSTVNATVGQTTPVSLEAQAAPAPATPAPETTQSDKPAAEERSLPEAPPPEPPRPTKLRPFAYVAGGIGVAGMATFAVFGLLSNSTYSDLRNTCPQGCLPAHKSEVDSGVMQQTLANVGLGVGIAGLAAGVTMFFVSMPASSPAPSAPTALVLAPGYIGLRGSM